MALRDYDADQLAVFKEEVSKKYDELKSRNLKLDLTRGKPSAEQLDFSNEILHLPGDKFKAADGTDCRNYGGLTGIQEIRQIWSEATGIPLDNLFALMLPA